MKRIITLTVLLLVVIQSFSQEIIKTILSEEDPFGLYLNDNKSDTLSYYDLTPEKNNGTVLVLLSGFFRNSKDVFKRTNLPEIAFENNIATLIPTINSRIHLDTAGFNLISHMILDYSKQKNIEIKNIIIGGLSAGGILSLSYTIWLNKNPHLEIPIPKATFTIDSPVDLYNFWFIEKRLAERNCSEAAAGEANYVLNYLNENLGGTPETIPESYKETSPFSRIEKNGGNIIYLRNIPVRAYCEPDIDYHLKKCEDYFDMNASDLSAMINQLKILGNDKAELITTFNKGYRLDGTRHPHSWSILDSEECIEWIKEIIK